jgi:hypothetical protein
MQSAVTEASSIVGALQNLRDGRFDRALEMLELELDGIALLLDSLADDVEPDERALILETLCSIRNYRDVHPRRPETDLREFESDVVADASELQEKAKKVLDNHRDGGSEKR